MASPISANRAELLAIADFGGDREDDRQGDRHRGDGRGDPEERAQPLWRRERHPRQARSAHRRPAAVARRRSGRGGRGLLQAGRSQGRAEARRQRQARRFHRRSAARGRSRPDRRPVGQAGDLPEGPRRRARAPVRGIQGPRRRDHHRGDQVGRIRPCHRQSRPRRGRHPPRPADPARSRPRRRAGARLHHEGRAQEPRPADLPVAAPIPSS